MDSFLNSFTAIGYGEVFLRIFLAGFFSFLLGYERQIRDKPMGCRSYMIVSITTCLLAMMGLELFANYNGNGEGFLALDLGKIIAGTLTGIGFLGAGAILRRDDNHVIGTATGASVWASGTLGLVIGFGFYALAAIGYITILGILYVFSRFPICSENGNCKK